MPFWKKMFNKRQGVYYPRAVVQGKPVDVYYPRAVVQGKPVETPAPNSF